jgi:recA bacterial DNA recombination protein
MASNPAFAALRATLERQHREASAAAFSPSDPGLLQTALPAFDTALGGGFPRGTIATLEGPPSSGRSALTARLLAVATRDGLGALIGTELFPPALAAAGVELARLLYVPVEEPLAIARATDIVVRSGAFGIVVIPALPAGPGTGAPLWTRLASLAHRSGTLLIAVGSEVSSELGYFASVRVTTAIERVRWNGPDGHLCELAGYDVRATVRKHKRTAPGRSALIACTSFEDRPGFVGLRTSELVTPVPATQRPSATRSA